MRTLATLVIVVVVACGYRPGSYDSPITPFVGQLASVGCLDVAVDRRPDTARGDAVVSYSFGNRCDAPTLVDLSAVTVYGRDGSGTDARLGPYDPAHVIVPLRIDGRSVGREVIAYPHGLSLRELWVNVGAIAHEQPTWLRFTSAGTIAEVP